MAFKDHRDFFELLDKEGELLRIKQEVDWDIEAGAIGRKAYELEGPCILFEKIKDYHNKGMISNGTTGTWPRVALALGLPKTASIREIYRHYEEKMDKKIPPRIIKKENAPCKEHIMIGDKIDLYEFPSPMIHEGDGGRYIGSWDLVVSKDPDTGWTNWGMYRFMVHSKNWIAGWPQYNSHLSMMFKEKYLPKNKPIPVAIVVGTDPVSHILATAPFPPQLSEVEISGGMQGEPIELVPCETVDLLVPAHSEIVIEGEILPDGVSPDGPFGEYPGFRSGTMGKGVAMKVTAVTYRSRPIVTMISLGMPPDDASIAAALSAAASMKSGLIRRGIPVTDVYVPPEGVTHLIVIGVKKGGPEMARKVLDFFTARRVWTNKHIMVDADVDVFNMSDVIHSFAAKCHPGKGIHLEHYENRANPLTPFYSIEERKRLKGVSVIFDCTWPPDWSADIIPPKVSYRNIYSKETQEKVDKNWKKYGFK